MKPFANDELNVAKIVVSVFDKKENAGKTRKCWFPVFSPFPQCFQTEASSSGSLKRGGGRSPVEATFLSGVFSPLTSVEAREKSSR